MNKELEHYQNFVSKTLDEQATEITTDLVWKKRNLLFDFDNQDDIKREDYIKELVGASIFFPLVTAIDLRVLNGMKGAKNMGPLRKFMFLNVL